MVFDAHNRAFAFFGGACRRGVYDNMKTAVTRILRGKEQNFNRRFEQRCSHYLFEPVACTPAAGWEKGQIENQVRTVRRRLFTPRRKVEFVGMPKAYDEVLASGRKHRQTTEMVIKELFQVKVNERPCPFHPLPYVPGPLPGAQGPGQF